MSAQGTAVFAADDGGDVAALIVNLLTDSDKDMQHLGMQQVREEAKGPEATRKFAALLLKLPPDDQAGLLDALADRGDAAASPAVRDLLESRELPVRLAALRALGPLGEKTDVARLTQTLAGGDELEQAAARASLIRLQGPEINAAIVAALKPAKSAVRAKLLGVLTTRRAIDSIPDMLAMAAAEDTESRAAAMTALGELAGPEHVPAMLKGVLAAPKGPQRDAAEKAVTAVCNRIKDANGRAKPILSGWASLSESDRVALLPTLGRVGGSGSLAIAEAAIGSQNPQSHEAGLRALCNWPDASVCARLMQLAESEKEATLRNAAVRALIRVAALPDKRPDAEKLDLLKKALTMTTRVDDRNYLIQRCQAIRTIESLRFVVPYLDEPEYAQAACATVVDLARHRELREPNKAEFTPALDAVIRISKDPSLIDRAQRYQQGKT
jgi:HEAT repeat protein